MKKRKLSIKELLVVLYELSISFGLPIISAYMILKYEISVCFFTSVFIYCVPALSHAGVFGKKAKEKFDNIMEYNF